MPTLDDTTEPTTDNLWNDGLKVRRDVLGEEYVNRSLTANAGTESEILQVFVTETVWGRIWTRPGLDKRSRSLLNIGMLIALNQHHELSVHVRGALRNGLTRDEIVEAVLQATVYCGAPAGLAAMRIVQGIFEESDGGSAGDRR